MRTATTDCDAAGQPSATVLHSRRRRKKKNGFTTNSDGTFKLGVPENSCNHLLALFRPILGALLAHRLGEATLQGTFLRCGQRLAVAQVLG